MTNFTPYFLYNPDSAYNLAGCDAHEITLAVAHNLGLLVLELRAMQDLKRDQFQAAEDFARRAAKAVGVES